MKVYRVRFTHFSTSLHKKTNAFHKGQQPILARQLSVTASLSSMISFLCRMNSSLQNGMGPYTSSILAKIIIITVLAFAIQGCGGSTASGSNSTGSSSTNRVDDKVAAKNALMTFCDALQKRDYSTAYSLLPPDTQVNITKAEFIREVNNGLGGIANPTTSPISIWATPDPNAYYSLGATDYNAGKISMSKFVIEALAVTDAFSVAGHDVPATATARVSWSFSNGTTSSDAEKSHFNLKKENSKWEVELPAGWMI